jgi:hypothetical protein
MKIGKYFTLHEMERSDTAKRLGISNKADEASINNAKELCRNLLDPLREFWGPIYISSWYRSEALNQAIGGATGSHHMTGNAVDIDLDGIDENGNKEIFHLIRVNFDFHTLIWEFGDDNKPDWVHISWFPNNNPKRVLRAIKENGKTKYEPYK